VTAQNELSISSFVALQEIMIRHTVRVVISSIVDTLIFIKDNRCRRDDSLYTVGAGCIISKSEFELHGREFTFRIAALLAAETVDTLALPQTFKH
jgi:hypothetical protein